MYWLMSLKFMMNFGWFVVHEPKFTTGQLLSMEVHAASWILTRMEVDPNVDPKMNMWCQWPFNCLHSLCTLLAECLCRRDETELIKESFIYKLMNWIGKGRDISTCSPAEQEFHSVLEKKQRIAFCSQKRKVPLECTPPLTQPPTPMGVGGASRG